MVGTSSVNERFVQVGREQAKNCLQELEKFFRLKVSLGYASTDQRLPWHEACHLAFAPLPSAGGPNFIAAGMYRVQGQEIWFPLIAHDADTYSMNGVTGCLGDILGAMSVDAAFVVEPLVLVPPMDAFYSWLGFLTELRNHPEGLPVIE